MRAMACLFYVVIKDGTAILPANLYKRDEVARGERDLKRLLRVRIVVRVNSGIYDRSRVYPSEAVSVQAQQTQV